MTATQAKSIEDPSLLVTDDDEDTWDRLCDFFRSEGYRPLRATSGQEAIHIAREAFLHFLILDMHLPDLSGIEAFRIITREKRIIVPCIFISSHATKEQKLKALSAQAFAYVPKPLDFRILRLVAEQILDKFYSPDAG